MAVLLPEMRNIDRMVSTIIKGRAGGLGKGNATWTPRPGGYKMIIDNDVLQRFFLWVLAIELIVTFVLGIVLLVLLFKTHQVNPQDILAIVLP